MLDNLEHDALFDVARTLKAEHIEARLRGEGGRGFLLESSGGIEENNLDGRLSKGPSSLISTTAPSPATTLLADLSHYVCPDIDIISTSTVHQSVQHIDFSLKIRPGRA